MRILHYFLGPYRQGGLNRYARDLALAQQKAGHDCSFICPEGGLFLSNKPLIKFKGKWNGVQEYHLLHGKPVPLL